MCNSQIWCFVILYADTILLPFVISWHCKPLLRLIKLESVLRGGEGRRAWEGCKRVRKILCIHIHPHSEICPIPVNQSQKFNENLPGGTRRWFELRSRWLIYIITILIHTHNIFHHKPLVLVANNQNPSFIYGIILHNMQATGCQDRVLTRPYRLQTNLFALNSCSCDLKC